MQVSNLVSLFDTSSILTHFKEGCVRTKLMVCSAVDLLNIKQCYNILPSCILLQLSFPWKTACMYVYFRVI